MDISFNYSEIIKPVTNDSEEENNPDVMYMDEQNGALRGNSLGPNFDVLNNYRGAFTRQTNVFKDGGLGNRYFYETSKRCNNVEPSWQDVADGSYNRFVLIDNRPNISDFDEPPGLLTSLLTNIKGLNPMNALNALIPEIPFDTENDCVEVKVFEKKQNSNGNVDETERVVYMTRNDIRDVDPCYFAENLKIDGVYHKERHNPITRKPGIRCDEKFTTIAESDNYSQMPDDKLIQLYLTTLTILGMYVVLKLVSKH